MRSAQPGWITVAQHDARRGIWYRMPSAEELEICAGREGDDLFLHIRKDQIPAATFDALVAVMQLGEWARVINDLPTATRESVSAAGPIAAEAIVEALKSAGQYGHGGRSAEHTWPLSLEELRLRMSLPKARKPELQRAFRALSKRVREVGVFYAFYPTGWRFDPRVIRPS